MRTAKLAVVLGAALLAGGCVSLPTGPRVMVLPGTGKNFDQFRADDMDCRQFASGQIGGSPQNAAANSGVQSAVVGTAIGAIAGAAIGGSSGAAVGAGTGLLFGSAAGSGAANASQYELQRRYDNGYQQCMYSKGHKIPTAGNYGGTAARPVTRYTPPPPPPSATAPAPSYSTPAPNYGSNTPPPPPAGAPPPPPPGVN